MSNYGRHIPGLVLSSTADYAVNELEPAATAEDFTVVNDLQQTFAVPASDTAPASASVVNVTLPGFNSTTSTNAVVSIKNTGSNRIYVYYVPAGLATADDYDHAGAQAAVVMPGKTAILHANLQNGDLFNNAIMPGPIAAQCGTGLTSTMVVTALEFT